MNPAERPIYDIRSTTVVVSGFAPVHALTLFLNGVRIMTATDYGQIRPFISAQRVQCPNCHGNVIVPDLRLGVPLCTTCAIHFSTMCLRRHNRLPRAGEFWCRKCGKILMKDQLQARSSNGRQRWSCAPCYRLQLRTLRQKRKLAENER